MEGINSSSTISIGNYKGIMLCNRPTAPALSDNQKQKSNNNSSNDTSFNANRPNFACGVISEAPGMSVSILNKEKVKVKKDKSDSVLSKHKKWLMDLQKSKEQMELDAIEERKRKAEVAQRLADIARNKQSNINVLMKSKLIDTKDENFSLENLNTVEISSEHRAESKESKIDNKNNNTSADQKQSYKASESKSSRPAWALSAKETEEVEELNEFADSEGLLDFAQSLDYNKYINDIEVKMMIEQMKKRIQELEKEITEDDKKEISDAKELISKKDKLLQMGNAVASLSMDECNMTEDSYTKSLNAAKAVLAKDSELSSVHSTRSVAAMIKTTLDINLDNIAQPKVHNEPRIALHEPNEGLRRENVDVSNLPYLHRNPAV